MTIFLLTGKPIAYTTLRLLDAACDLEPAWTEIDLDEVILKIVKFLYMNTCQLAVGGYDEHLLSQTAKNHLTAPGFSFCFPLMQRLLITRSSNMVLLEQILSIISEHSDIRNIDPSVDRVSFFCGCLLEYSFYALFLKGSMLFLENWSSFRFKHECPWPFYKKLFRPIIFLQ